MGTNSAGSAKSDLSGTVRKKRYTKKRASQKMAKEDVLDFAMKDDDLEFSDPPLKPNAKSKAEAPRKTVLVVSQKAVSPLKVESPPMVKASSKRTFGKKAAPSCKNSSPPKAKVLANGTAGKDTAGEVTPARKARSPAKAKVSAKVTSGEKAKGTAGKKAKTLAVGACENSDGEYN